MLLKILIILPTLGTTVGTGGHLVLAFTVLPKTLKNREHDYHILGVTTLAVLFVIVGARIRIGGLL